MDLQESGFPNDRGVGVGGAGISPFVKIVPNSNVYCCFPSKLKAVERIIVTEQKLRIHFWQWAFLGLVKMWELQLLPIPSCLVLLSGGRDCRTGLGVCETSVGPADTTLYRKYVVQCGRVIPYRAGTLKDGSVYIIKWVKRMLHGYSWFGSFVFVLLPSQILKRAVTWRLLVRESHVLSGQKSLVYSGYHRCQSYCCVL